MSADPFEPTSRAPAESGVEPLYFPSGDRGLFGWIHWPAGGVTSRFGLLICKPFGFEAVCSYLSQRAFAEAVAKLGIPVMRFDYSGTGDSVDLDPDANQIDIWRRDVVAACEELRRRTGVARLCLLGFRLGAALAAMAAPDCAQGGAIAAIAPVVSGRRYFRELRTFELAAARQDNPAAGGEPAAATQVPGAASMEVSGFPLAAESIAALRKVELTELAQSPLSEALIIDRSDLPAARTWSERLGSQGVRVRYVSMPGFVEMMMRPPDLTVTPSAMIDEVCGWLERLERQSQDESIGSRRLSPSPWSERASRSLRLTSEDGPAVCEQPVLLAGAPALFGIVTEPVQEEKRRRGVILINSGGDYHIGPRRMYVSLARRWARNGYVVLRMDLAGLGDSVRHADRPGNEIYPPSAIDDIRAGVSLLRDRYGVRELTLGGLCTGAYHSLQAAMQELPVDRLLLVNQLTFFWRDGQDPTDIQEWEVVHKPGAYRRQLFSIAAWRRLLTRDVSLWRVLKVYLQGPAVILKMRLRGIARRLNMPLRDDLVRELEKIAARGTRVVFVFSRGDAGISLLTAKTGLSLAEIGKRYRVRLVDGADHNLTRSGPRVELERVLSEELFARNDKWARGGAS